MLLRDLQPKDQKIVYNHDGLCITHTKDSAQAMLENAGFVALDIPNIVGATIVDINYENTWFDRDGTWDLDCSNIVVTLLLKDKTTRRWVIQADEENNRGGYIGEFDMNGEMITNPKEGKRYRELQS